MEVKWNYQELSVEDEKYFTSKQCIATTVKMKQTLSKQKNLGMKRTEVSGNKYSEKTKKYYFLPCWREVI